MTIRFDGVTFAYPGSGENVFENLSFSVDTEWKTGLIGRNGRGKTTLLRLMAGEFVGEYSGSIRRPAGAELFPCPVREEDMPARRSRAGKGRGRCWRRCFCGRGGFC